MKVKQWVKIIQCRKKCSFYQCLTNSFVQNQGVCVQQWIMSVQSEWHQTSTDKTHCVSSQVMPLTSLM